MASTGTAMGIRLPLMGNQRKQPDNRPQKDRVSINLPAKWHAVIRQMVAKTRQPVTFLLISLIMAEAERLGIEDIPTPPWEED
jgi:hypothetical protein